MIPRTRRKPADFAEVLAELERAEVDEPSRQAELDAANDRPRAGAAEPVPNSTDSETRSGNRLAHLLSGFSRRGTRDKGAVSDPESKARSAFSLCRNFVTRAGVSIAGARSEAAGARGAATYAQEAADRPSPDAPAVESQPLRRRLPKSENEVIADELGLARRLGKAALLELRREFARKNHPDRCPPAKRPRAARRMAIANMLIDAELKKLRR